MFITTPFPQLNSKTIHIWKIDLEALSLSNYPTILNAAEIEKARRFKFEKDQKSFVISRAILKMLIGSYIEQSSFQITFETNAYGKLFLPQPYSFLQFNLSHSADITLIAITLDDSIGIDTEYMDSKINYVQIVKRYFSKEEQLVYQQLPVEQQLKSFYSLWTQKEAFLKALGKGIYYYPLKNFTISESSPSQIQFYSNEENFEKTTDWHFHSFNPKEQYQAAVCWKGLPKNIIQLVYNNSSST